MNRFWVLLLSSCIVPTVVFAQNPPVTKRSIPGAQALPSGVPELPSASSGSLSGTLINSANAAPFRQIIIPELYPLVRSGILEIDAVKELGFEWRREEEWERKSRGSRVLDINAQGGIEGGVQLEKGFPFGDRDGLLRAYESKQIDAKTFAYRVLWNIQAGFWSQKILRYDFNLFWFKDNKLGREVRGNIDRVYPRSIFQTDKSNQLFRERVKISWPLPVSGLSFLSFRFLGPEEDVLWLYSPAIKKARELTSSNRTDGLLRSAVSLDDLFIWSGKPELFEARYDETLVALVPFPELMPVNAKTVGTCKQVSGVAERRPQVADSAEGVFSQRSSWNFESKKFLQGAPWLPTQAVWIPRELWRFELTSRDPYSLYGRQVLYVDTQSMLPVYKVVYDRAGHQWKTFIAAFGMAQDSTQRFPYHAFMLADDRLKAEAFVLDFSNARFCDNFHEDLSLSDFEPRRLGPGEDDTQVPPGEKKGAKKPSQKKK